MAAVTLLEITGVYHQILLARGDTLDQLLTSVESDGIEIACFGIEVYFSATMHDKHRLTKDNFKSKGKSHWKMCHSLQNHPQSLTQ